MGFDETQARALTLHTFAGAAQLAMQSHESAAALREKVTSKGGTTAAALASFERDKVDEAIARADSCSRRACARARQLGQQAGLSKRVVESRAGEYRGAYPVVVPERSHAAVARTRANQHEVIDRAGRSDCASCIERPSRANHAADQTTSNDKNAMYDAITAITSKRPKKIADDLMPIRKSSSRSTIAYSVS